MKFTKHIYMMVLLAILCGNLYAANVNYIGPEGGDFFTATNWSTGALPGTDDVIVIDNAAELVFDNAASEFEIAGLNVGNVQAVSNNLHRFKMNAGLLYVLGGGITMTVGSPNGYNAHGAMTMNGGEIDTYHLTIGDLANGVLYMNGGTICSMWSVSLAGNSSGAHGYGGTMFLDGGTVNTDRLFIYDSGSIVISDGVLEVGRGTAVKDTMLGYIKKGLIAPAAGYKLVTSDWHWGTGLRVSAEKIEPAVMFTPGYGFTSSDRIVSTVMFSWYDWPPTWQQSGPWLPLEGREAWNGDPDWWKEQIKQVMAADIDYMWLHNWYDNPLFGLYAAYYEMRMAGYDVPKVAPYIDLAITYGSYSVNLATEAGKDDFVGKFIQMYKGFFISNPDPNADNFLAQIDGKVILAMYSLPENGNVQNISSLTREDVESRLAAEFGAKHPVFNNGVYAIRAYPSGISWADEKIKQFCGGTYLDVQNYNGVKSARLQPGYWDQNIRTPGLFLPRNGGTNYKSAWNSVLADSTINHVNVESFNEYDEGSGIYAVDVVNSPDLMSWVTNNDTWSTTNDPLEYIKTTAVKASQFNFRVSQDAKVIWHNIPATMKKGQIVPVTVVVRNEGDNMWTGAAGYAFAEKEGTSFLTPGTVAINDANDQISFFGGIFRGRPVKFNFTVTAPQAAGSYTIHLQMKQGSTYFGEDKAITIDVAACSAADLTDDCKVNFSDLSVLAGNWLKSM